MDSIPVTVTRNSSLREVFRGRNEAGWSSVVVLLERAGEAFSLRLIPSLEESVRHAKETAGVLACAVHTAKREGVYDALANILEDTPGNFLGTRLVNFSFAHIDAELSADLKPAWGGIKQQMSSTIEMVIKDLLPTIPDHAPPLQPEQVFSWIDKRGGIGKLGIAFMNYRRETKDKIEARKEADRKYGQIMRQVREAERFYAKHPDLRPAIDLTAPEPEDAAAEGEDTDPQKLLAGLAPHEALIKAYLTAKAEIDKSVSENKLRSKFGLVKDRLVKNGTVIDGEPPDNRLFIPRDGKRYLISEQDEYLLLSCEAGVL